MNASYFVSVVVPLHDDADIFDGFARELVGIVRSTWHNHEIVFVDDGSRDGTQAAVMALLAEFECLRYVRLSRSVGVEIAISAGLDTVIGDVVVVLEPASDPPSFVPRMVEDARKANGVVFGVRSTSRPEPIGYALGRKAYTRLIRSLLGIELPENATLFLAMTRQTMNAVAQIKDRARALRIFGAVVGFQHRFVEYEATDRRSPPRRKAFLEGVERALSLVVTNSMKPLRIVSVLGLFLAVLNVAYLGYVVAVVFFKKHVAEGWVTLSVQHAVMFVFLFLILAALCEYVGRLLDETRERPLYFVAEERTSSVMVRDADRPNVVGEST